MFTRPYASALALLLAGCAYYPKTNEIRYGLDLPRDTLVCFGKVRVSDYKSSSRGYHLGMHCAF